MYRVVDDKDQVIELTDVPQSCVGAPIPIVLAGEHDVILTYYLQDITKDWKATHVRVVDVSPDDEPIAIVKFKWCYAHMFGPPNDEAFSGHPLESRGLRPYSAFEILDSSWLRELEQMNSVHRCHDKRQFMQNKKHFIFAFHDTTFECIAEHFDVEIRPGSTKYEIERLLESFN